MKIALFTVPSSSESFGHEKLFLSEPLGLEYIAAGVENEHDVQIFELRQTDEYEKILIEKVETKKPDIIGCGANTADVMMVTNLFKRIKSLNSKILTVVGGHHATIMPEDFFTEHVDVIVQGNGVKAFRKVCNHHQVNKSFETIENIYYKKNGEICYTHREELQSLDDIPFPARHLTSDFRYKYKQPVFFGTTPVALVMGSTGCPYKCKFCGIARVSNNKMISRSIESIIKEISGLKEESIMWVDDEFLIKHKRALAIAEAIEKSGIKKNYWFYGRSSNIVKHPECIEVWSKIGLKFVMIGLESHREADLTEVGKATTKSLNEEAVKICHRYNVKVKGNFIVHYNFDKQDFRELKKYVKKIKVDVPSVSILTPLPGTDYYDEVKSDLITNNYNLFDLSHAVLPTTLPLKEFYKEFTKATFSSHSSFFRQIMILLSLDRGERKRVIKSSIDLKNRLLNAHLSY